MFALSLCPSALLQVQVQVQVQLELRVHPMVVVLLVGLPQLEIRLKILQFNTMIKLVQRVQSGFWLSGVQNLHYVQLPDPVHHAEELKRTPLLRIRQIDRAPRVEDSSACVLFRLLFYDALAMLPSK